jgi:hypothetical protein
MPFPGPDLNTVSFISRRGAAVDRASVADVDPGLPMGIHLAIGHLRRCAGKNAEAGVLRRLGFRLQVVFFRAAG